MEVAEASPSSSVTVNVDFARPFVAHNVNRFTLEPRGSSTTVTWAMQGTQPFMLKLMSIFISPDKLLGSHFETGLASLKAAAESDAV